MQGTITYKLSESAQRAQMAATGQPVARKQIKIVELMAEDLALFDVDHSGVSTLDTTQPFSARNIGEISDANADVLALVRAKIAADAAEKERERQITILNGVWNSQRVREAYEVFLADPAARMADWHLELPGLRAPADYFLYNHTDFIAEIKRRNAADAAAKKSAEDAKETAKTQFLDEWVAASGSAKLQRQWKEGLLARRDLLNMIAAQTFADLGIAEHKPTVCENGSCACGIKDVSTLPLDEYAAWDKIRESLPEGTKAEFEVSRDCLRDDEGGYDEDEEDATEPYYTALLHFPNGPFVFDRRIKL